MKKIKDSDISNMKGGSYTTCMICKFSIPPMYQYEYNTSLDAHIMWEHHLLLDEVDLDQYQWVWRQKQRVLR